MPAPGSTTCADRKRPAVRNGAGVQRLLAAPIEGEARALLAPYLDVLRALNPGDELATYPGSPAIARALMRQDSLVACEIEPNAAAALARNLGGDRRFKAVAIDGWTALNAYVPPPERRGVVLVDPPFEAADEFSRLAQTLEAAHRKWATGIFLVWYPVKSRRATDDLARHVAEAAGASTAAGKCLRLEFSVAPQAAGGRPDIHRPLASSTRHGRWRAS